MANWDGKNTPKENINGGQEYNAGDKVKTSDFNAAINNTIYASEFVDAMTAEVGSHTGSSSNPPTVSFDAQTKIFTFDYLKGEKGNTGDAAGFGTPTATATARNANQTPTVSVSSSGADTAKVFSFSFGIPKGTTFTPSVDANGNISWTNDGGLSNPTTRNIKGQQGETGTGITSISKTGTSGLTDTYTINYSNNTTSTYTVTNGKAATVNGSATGAITFSLSNNNTVLNITVG